MCIRDRDSTVLKITGGTFYSETAGKRNWIYAGSGAENGGVVSHKNSTLILDGSQNGFTPLQGTTQNQTHGQFFGGGLNATLSDSVNVLVENIAVGLIDSKNTVKTLSLIHISGFLHCQSRNDDDHCIE